MAMVRWLDLRHATRGWFTLPHGCSRRGLRLRVTPRKENKGFARYLGGFSEVCFTMWPTASANPAWNIALSACRPASFTRTSLARLEHDSCTKILQLRDNQMQG